MLGWSSAWVAPFYMLLGSQLMILVLPLLQKLVPFQRALFSVEPVLSKVETRDAIRALGLWFGWC